MSRDDLDNKGARGQVFAKLRAALKDGPAAADRRANVEQRLASPPKHPLPARVDKSKPDLRAQFRAFLEGQSATVLDVIGSAAVPMAIMDYLRANNLPQEVRSGDDPYLAALPWNTATTLQRHIGPATATDAVGLSHAVAAVAETGTLALVSGPDNPVTLAFVPENHIIVVEEADLYGPHEQAWARIRERFGKGKMPRTVNFISGPSRTADIGGKLVTGAHGPRRLCVILVRG